VLIITFEENNAWCGVSRECYNSCTALTIENVKSNERTGKIIKGLKQYSCNCIVLTSLLGSEEFFWIKWKGSHNGFEPLTNLVNISIKKAKQVHICLARKAFG